MLEPLQRLDPLVRYTLIEAVPLVGLPLVELRALLYQRGREPVSTITACKVRQLAGIVDYRARRRARWVERVSPFSIKT